MNNQENYQGNHQGYRCSLHGQSFQFFCERCMEPVCKQCTIIGPHHTQIHSLTKISIAYERKVQQIRERIQAIVDGNRDRIFKIISQLNTQISDLQSVRKSLDAENNRQKEKMVMILMKQFQNNRNILHSYRQNLLQKSNLINDLGFRYQNIKSDIELLGSHHKIIQQLKQSHDRVQIVLEKEIPVNPYTKELTNIRISLKQVQCLKQFYQQKLKILSLIMTKTDKLPTITHSIDQEALLAELNKNLGQIRHYICHFCGVPFSSSQINNVCLKNSMNMNFSVSHLGSIHFGASSQMTSSANGFCDKNPDTNKVGTHRHFFGQPKNIISLYGPQATGSFKMQLDALLLKVKTLCKLKNVKLRRQFGNNDKSGSLFCQKIVFDYIFIQILGMSQHQKYVIKSLSKVCLQNSSLLSYSQILEEIQKIDI